MNWTTPVLAALLLVTIQANAASHRMIRCQGGVVMAGMDKYEVIAKCGMPLDQEEISGGGARVKEERMLYRLSKTAPMKVITIRDGKVTNIESLD